MRARDQMKVAERRLIMDVQRIRRKARELRLGGTDVKCGELLQQIRYEVAYFPWNPKLRRRVIHPKLK